MTRTLLREANRALLDAIATPPDTGRERDLDRIAAQLHALTVGDRPRAPDPGRLALLRQKLRALEANCRPDRLPAIRTARHCLRTYQRRANLQDPAGPPTRA